MRQHAIHDHVSGTLSELDHEVVRHVPPGGNWRDLPEDFASARVRQIRESAARGEGSRSTYYGRLSWDRPAYTISTYITRPGNGAFIHPVLPRLITVREAARLQSFPDAVRFHGTLRQRCVQVGNAVPPLLAYRIGREICAGTAVDLFAGAGGVGLGLEWAGHEVVVSADFDAQACRTLESHAGADHLVLRRDLSDEAQLRDVVAAVRARLAGRELGLLAGGPPCQGFSTAGPCRVDDPRNLLVMRFLRAVELLRPQHVLFENVLALKWRGRAFLEELVERLGQLDYDVEMRVLHAEAYGVPQLRRRLVLQAVARGGAIRWPDPSHAMSDPCFSADQPGARLKGPRASNVGDAISDLAVPSAASLEHEVEALPANTPYARWARGESSLDALTGDGDRDALDERMASS